MDTETHPMNIKRTIAAVMRAPLLAGDSIPNMANTERGWGVGGGVCVGGGGGGGGR